MLQCGLFFFPHRAVASGSEPLISKAFCSSGCVQVGAVTLRSLSIFFLFFSSSAADTFHSPLLSFSFFFIYFSIIIII